MQTYGGVVRLDCRQFLVHTLLPRILDGRWGAAGTRTILQQHFFFWSALGAHNIGALQTSSRDAGREKANKAYLHNRKIDISAGPSREKTAGRESSRGQLGLILWTDCPCTYILRDRAERIGMGFGREIWLAANLMDIEDIEHLQGSPI